MSIQLSKRETRKEREETIFHEIMIFSTNDVGQTGYFTCKKMKLDSYHIPYTKTNSEWIKTLNGRAKSMKLLEENIRGNLHAIGFGSDILDMTPKAGNKRKKTNNLDCIKTLNFPPSKDTSTE